MILSFDGVELKVDVLREISHEREDFAHALVHDAQCGEEVDDGGRDGLGALFPPR